MLLPLDDPAQHHDGLVVRDLGAPRLPHLGKCVLGLLTTKSSVLPAFGRVPCPTQSLLEVPAAIRQVHLSWKLNVQLVVDHVGVQVGLRNVDEHHLVRILHVRLSAFAHREGDHQIERFEKKHSREESLSGISSVHLPVDLLGERPIVGDVFLRGLEEEGRGGRRRRVRWGGETQGRGGRGGEGGELSGWRGGGGGGGGVLLSLPRVFFKSPHNGFLVEED